MPRAPPLAIVLILIGAILAVPPVVKAEDAAVYTVTGRVVSDQGAPLEGAEVYGYTTPAERSAIETKAHDVTDADGAFEIQLAAGNGWLNVQYAKWRQGEGKEIVVDGNLSGIEFVLKTPPPKTALVEGTILDESGNPIEGATVTLGQGCCYAYAVPTPAPASEPASEPAEATTTRDGGDAAASEATTRPAFWCCPDADYAEPVTTGPDGKYRFETYAGPRQVTATAKGYAQTTLSFDALDGQTVTQDVTLEKVPPADALIQGRVVDAQTGQPLAHAQISLNGLEWSRWGWAQTDSLGRFQLKTIPGWIEINVHYAGSYGDPMPIDAAESDLTEVAKVAPTPGKQYYQYARTFEAKSGDNALDIQLEPKPEPNVVLVGYVIDAQLQKGIPGAQVNVWNQDTGDWGNAITDKTGSYRILVRPGHYVLRAYADHHLGGVETFRIADDETATRADVTLSPGSAKYAPCDASDDCGGGITMYASEAKATDAATPSAAPQPALAEGASAPSASMTNVRSVNVAQDSDGRAATYQGSGGGLPEYDPAHADDPTAQTAKTRGVPAPSLALGLLALAGAVLLARRR